MPRLKRAHIWCSIHSNLRLPLRGFGDNTLDMQLQTEQSLFEIVEQRLVVLETLAPTGIGFCHLKMSDKTLLFAGIVSAYAILSSPEYSQAAAKCLTYLTNTADEFGLTLMKKVPGGILSPVFSKLYTEAGFIKIPVLRALVRYPRND